jgi:hypothetical protein
MRPGTAVTKIDLQFHRGEVRQITMAATCWLSRWRDTGYCPIARKPDRLRELITGGCRAHAVPSEVAS